LKGSLEFFDVDTQAIYEFEVDGKQ